MKKSLEKQTEEIEKIGNEIKHTLKLDDGNSQQEKIIEIIAVAGAAAFVLYGILKFLFGNKESGKKKSSKREFFTKSNQKDSGFFDLIKDQLFIFLASFVQDTVKSYLQNSTNGRSHSKSDSKKEKN